MTPSDVEAVHELDVRAFPTPWTAQNYQHELQSSYSNCWVAIDTEQVVGMVVAWLLVDEIHIATIAVDENYRRRGIAANLLCRAIEPLADRGAQSATLEVRESNTAAQNLYLRFGFVVVGRRKNYYRDNHEDALLMTVVPLTPALEWCENLPKLGVE